MNDNLEELYQKIQEKNKFGLKEIKPGTYCFEKTNQSGQVTTASATFVGSTTKKYELNIICKKDGYGYRATFGLKEYVGNNSYRDAYRIDYNDKHGWHIDSTKYKLKHYKLTITTWQEALSKIVKHAELFPLTIPDVFLKFTDPESNFRI